MSISDAESHVIEFLWINPGATAAEVHEALGPDRDWQEATVKTLLNRLLNKGAIRSKRNGRRFQYFPVLERESWMLTETRHLLDRLFDGRLAPLVAHFCAHQKLSRQDLKDLKSLIHQLEDEHPDD